MTRPDAMTKLKLAVAALERIAKEHEQLVPVPSLLAREALAAIAAAPVETLCEYCKLKDHVYRNARGELCGLCDGTYEHEHRGPQRGHCTCLRSAPVETLADDPAIVDVIESAEREAHACWWGGAREAFSDADRLREMDLARRIAIVRHLDAYRRGRPRAIDAIEQQPAVAFWRMAGCACPVDARPGERCNLKWTRCNERLRYLRPPAPVSGAQIPERQP